MQQKLEVLPWQHNNALYVLLLYIRRFQQYETHLGLSVKCRLLCPIFNKFDFSQ